MTRPVGVSNPAPPKGCSCVGPLARFCQILHIRQILGSVRGVPLADTFGASWLFSGPTWSNLAVLSAMFVHLVHPGFYLAPTWPIFAPTWPNLAPTWPNLVPSWPNLAPTWPAKSSPNPPKLVPESIKKAIKLPTNLWLDFSSALDTFFPKLASKLEGRGTQNH